MPLERFVFIRPFILKSIKSFEQQQPVAWSKHFSEFHLVSVVCLQTKTCLCCSIRRRHIWSISALDQLQYAFKIFFLSFFFSYFLCRGFIVLENKTFIIEPVSGHHTGAHFIYRVEELRLTTGACGHGFNLSSVAPENQIKSPFQSFHTRVSFSVAFAKQSQ